MLATFLDEGSIPSTSTRKKSWGWLDL